MRLYGKNPVLERLRANPGSVKKIYLQEGIRETAQIKAKAKKWGVPVYIVNRSKMMKMCRDKNSQGFLVEVEGFDYTPFEDLLEHAKKKKHALLFLDGLNDPQNLGGIIRSLACFGHFSIVLPTHGSVEVTEAVLRVSAGGDNYIKVAKVANLNRAILAAKEAGFWIAGTVVKGGKNLFKTEFSFPLGLVVGSEQKGIRDAVRKHLDIELTVPMAHQDTLSLNVAHATTILCYEIAKQSYLRKEK